MKYNLVNKEIRTNYIEELLRERGVKNIDFFLNPTAEALQTWRDLENIGIGAELLLDSIGTGPFALIVDCDTDGFSSSAIIYLYIKEKWPNQQIDYYLHDGKQHGLEDMWEKFQGSNYSLIIAPDSSTNDSIYVQKISIPVLVLDHHLFEGDEIHPSMTIINNQMSPNYKNKNLSGAGITWQFCRALDYALGENLAEKLIDLAAVGVCGDAMSGCEIENQYIWKKGFSNIKNKFLKALIEKQSYSMSGKINPTTVAFYIVPLINAMIRAGTQEEKERMFLAFIDGDKLIPCNKRGAKGTLERAAIESARECTNAKERQNRELDAAEIKVENKIYKFDLLENKILIICLNEDDDYPSKLNGLIAMRCAAKYRRPALVLRLNSDGELKGSARGINNGPIPNLKDFLDKSGYFEWTAGHPMAFGGCILSKNLEDFHKYANEKLKDVNFNESCYDVNFVRSAADKDLTNLINEVSRYEDIWSTGNDEPRIYVHDINISSDDIQIIGKNKDTVKFTKFGVTYIKFHAANLIDELRCYNEMKIEVVGRCNINEWMGNATMQILIDGYEVHDNELGF